MEPVIQEMFTVESPEQAVALLNPLRGEILSQLALPTSATEVAKRLNEKPQRINYHLKLLEKVGLVRRAGTRQVRNLVEVKFQSVARTFVLSEALGMKPETAQKLKDHGALSHLAQTAERLKQDALLLMERSDEEELVPSATLQLEVPLTDEANRAAFVEEYVAAVRALVSKYGTASHSKGAADTYKVMLAVYPEPKEGGTAE